MAWIASVGGGAGIWVKLPGEENLTMSRNCKSSLAWALLATLLLTRVLLAQSPNADLILIHGHILTLDGTDSLAQDRKSTRLNSSHVEISYAVFCLKKKTNRN